MGVSSDEENDATEQNRPATPKSKRLSRGGDASKSERPTHRPTRFSAEMQTRYPFLKPDPHDPYKCICKLCNGKPFRSETYDINRHTKGLNHQKKAEIANPKTQKNVLTMLTAKDPLEKKVKYAELKLAGYVAAHDEAFLKMDHLTDVLKDIFPDSKIAQELSMKRSKTRGLVVNVIGAAEKEELSAILKTTKFSILTDESTDISAVKTAAVMVQFYDKVAGRVVVRHWDLDNLFTDDDPEGAHIGATAAVLFQKLMSSFEAEGIPIENIIGFGSDGTNSMMGAHNSLASRFRELCPGIKIMKCICHSLHLCASDACKVLPVICEDLARLIYGYFSHSSKRQAQYRQFQKFFELEPHKILHPSQTRWLSLSAVVSRILENWEALKLFFVDQSLVARLKAAENIVNHMKNPTVKAYFLFLQWVLPKITGLNEYFQSEKPTITIIHNKMVQAYQEFLLMYMQRDYVMRTPLQDINPGDASRFIPLSNLYLGVDVKVYLERPEISERRQMVDDVLTRCQTFLVTLCQKMKEKYDFNDPVLSRMRLLNPDVAMSHRERETTPSIATLCFLLPRCVAREDVQAVDDEWRRLPLLVKDIPDEVKAIEEPDKFWHALLNWRTEYGEQPLKALPKFALAALSLPSSNASCERDFSKINNIKTKKRNKMITETVNGCLLASQAVRKSDGCCVQFKPTEAMYTGMTSAKIYKNARQRRTENEHEELDISSLFTFE